MEESHKEIMAEGRFIRLVKVGSWEYVERRNITGIVVLIPVTPRGELVMVEQYRVPMGKTVIELPAGLAGDIPGQELESLELAASRELEEETGFKPKTLRRVTFGPPSPGITDEVMNVFLAYDLEQTGTGGGDDSEDIRVHVVPLTEIHQWLTSHAPNQVLVDPKVYMGIYFAMRHLDGQLK